MPAENYETYGLTPDEATVAEFNLRRYRNDRSGFPANRVIRDSVIARVTWEGDPLAGISLYPITPGFGQPRSRRGRPMPADRELGEKILNYMIERSTPFSTTIRIRDGVEIMVLP